VPLALSACSDDTPPSTETGSSSSSTSQESRSEEHTSELQSQSNLVCRLLLEKKKSLYVHTGRYDICMRGLLMPLLVLSMTLVVSCVFYNWVTLPHASDPMAFPVLLIALALIL